MLVIDIIHSCIDYQYFHSFLSIYPFFMPLMNSLNIFQTYVLFTFSISYFYSLQAYLRRASQVNYAFYGTVLNQGLTNVVIYFIFMGLEISIFVHDLSKNISVSKWRSFRKEDFILLFLSSFFPKQGSGMKSIQLESKSPSFGIIIVFFQNVDSSDIFPKVNWLFDSINIQEAEKCRFTSSKITFYRNNSGHFILNPAFIKLKYIGKISNFIYLYTNSHIKLSMQLENIHKFKLIGFTKIIKAKEIQRYRIKYKQLEKKHYSFYFLGFVIILSSITEQNIYLISKTLIQQKGLQKNLQQFKLNHNTNLLYFILTYYIFIIKKQSMSLLRSEDYLYDHPKHVPNIYWSQLIKTVDEFEQLLQIEKKEITSFLKQKIHKKVDLIKKFYDYKQSIKVVGQNIKKDINVLDKQKFQLFFEGYSKQISHIIHYVLHNPKKFGSQIVKYKSHKNYNFMDFCQNIPVLIYPYYMSLNQNKTNNCLIFIEQIINIWPYSLQYARPKYNSLIDDIIYGFFKTPPILCYVEKISSKFLQEISNCRMEIFAFDQDAIKNEIDIKKHATVSYTQPEKKSFASRLKSLFRGGKDDNNISEQTMIRQSMVNMGPQKSDSQYSNVPQMMKKRQSSFIELIKITVENILNQEPPFLLKKMMQFFRKKLQIEMMKQKKQINNNEMKHYCYFLLTNFICVQLHNKFTIAHEQSGMTNADLQNISEIIRIISCIFQGQDPQLKRYKNVIHTLNQYKNQVQQFYNNFFNNDYNQNQQTQNQEMRQILIQYYQSNILLSFNDVKIIIDIYKDIRSQDSHQNDIKLHFLEIPQIKALYQPSKKIKFQNILYQPENVLFIQDWSEKSKKEIVQYFVVNQQPLEYLPILKDIFFFSSNLNVEESLEVAQDLKLIKKMPLKNIKQYLIKTANKFTHLNIKQFFTVQKAFKDSLKNCLRNNLKRKEYILYYRSQILYKLQEQNAFINYFINELKSQQFYQKVSENFIHNIKIKAFVNIQNNLLKINKQMKELKGLGVSNLMLASSDKSTSKSNQDYILRHSFKTFQGVIELMRCIGKNAITKSAFLTGRKVQQFNQTFIQLVDIVISYMSEFIKKKTLFQNLFKDKLQNLVVKKLQNMIYMRHCNNNQKQIQDDKKLFKMSEMIDKHKFYEHQIEKLGIQIQFLIQQGRQKFKLMIEQINVTKKIIHLQQLYKVIFTIIGFTIPINKVSSDIIAPITQFIILECSDLGHFKCLYAMECLKYTKVPQVLFQITNYRSSLMYIKQNMAFDYCKLGYEQQIKTYMNNQLQKKNAK